MAVRRLEIIIAADGSAAVTEIEDVGESVEGLGKKTEGAASAFGGWAAIAASAAAAVGAALLGVGAAALKVGEEYTAAFDQIRNTTGATGETFDGLKTSLAEVMGSGVRSSVEEGGQAIAGLYQQLGLTGPALETMAHQMLNLSSVTGSDVNEVVDTSAMLFKNWGVEVGAMPDQLDRLFRASQLSGISITDLSSSLTENAGILRSFGISLDESTNMMVNLKNAGIDHEIVLGALTEASANFAQVNEENMKAVAAAQAQVEQASNSLRKAQQNLYDLNERLAAQSQLSVSDDQGLRRATEAITDARIKARKADEDSIEKLHKSEQNLADLQQRMAAKGNLNVGDNQALARAQDAIREAQSMDKVRKAEQALADLRQRQKGKRRDVGDQQALRKAEEAITEAKEEQADRVAKANQSLIELQERLGARTDLTVEDQQALRKATEAITEAQEDRAETQESAAKDIEKAEQNLIDMQDRLHERSQLSLGDQQSLRRAHDAVAEAQQQMGVATGNLAKAQAAAAAAPKTLREALKQLWDEIVNAPDDLSALAAAVKLFGEEDAPKMVDAIRKGGLKFEDLFKPPKGLDQTKDAINKTAGEAAAGAPAVKSFGNWLGSIFGPKLSEMKTQYFDPAMKSINEWLQDKIPGGISFLKEKWDEYWPTISPTLFAVRDALKDVWEKVVEFYKEVTANKELMENLRIGFLVIGGILAGAFATGLAMGAMLVVGLGAAIALIVAGIGLFALKLGEAWRAAVAAWDGIKNAASSAWSWMTQTGQTAWNAITGGFNWVWQTAQNIFNGLRNFLGGIWGGVASAAQSAWNGVVNTLNWVVDVVRQLPSRIWNATRGMWDGMKEAFKSALNWIVDRWNNLRVPSKRIDVFGKSIDLGGWDFPDLPRLHAGGVFKAGAGNEGLALLRDGERVMTPSQGMATQTLAPTGTGGSTEVHIHVDGALVHDDRALMRYMAAGLSEHKRTGGRGPWN